MTEFLSTKDSTQNRLLSEAIITFNQEPGYIVFDSYNTYAGDPMATWGGVIESQTLKSSLNATRRVQNSKLRRKGLFQKLYEEVLPKLVAEGVNRIITETRVPSTARFFIKNEGKITNLEDLNYTETEIETYLRQGGHGNMPFTLQIETAIGEPLPSSQSPQALANHVAAA